MNKQAYLKMMKHSNLCKKASFNLFKGVGSGPIQFMNSITGKKNTDLFNLARDAKESNISPQHFSTLVNAGAELQKKVDTQKYNNEGFWATLLRAFKNLFGIRSK